jgi:curved DNA-binding protein CbpA
MRDKMDPYKMLGLSRNADQGEIRAAYRSLAKKYHPDAGQGSSAEKFRNIQDAYDLLSDVDRRRDYDRSSASESQRPIRRPSPYFSPFAHNDLRVYTDRRVRVRAEPIGFNFSMRPEPSDMDQWEDLLEFLFGAF